MMAFGNNLFSQDLAITVTTSNSAPIVSTKVDFTVTITHISGGTFNNVVGYFLFDECFLWAKMPDENFDITTGNFKVPAPIGPGQSYTVTFHAIYAPDFACGTAPAQWGAKAAIVSSVPTQNPASDVSAISATAIPIGGSYASIGVSFVPTVSSAAFPMGNSSYALKKFHLKGDILIDGPITFRDCELYIEPNVQITVLSNASLTFLNCHLYSCNTQWKGIVVEKSATLRSNNTAIEDANVAIFTKKGILSLKGNVFNNNYISIELEETHSPSVFIAQNNPNIPPNVIPAPISLGGNMFLGSGNFLLAPYTGEKPFIGIKGTYSYLVANSNHFMSLNAGFFFDRSHLDVRDGMYRDIRDYSLTSNFFDGCAVSVTTPLSMSSDCYLWVTSVQSSPTSNLILDTDMGIKVESANCIITNNVMYNVQKGVEVSFNLDRVCLINKNHIRATDVGIAHIHCYTNMLNRVEGNYINVNRPTPINVISGTIGSPPMGEGIGIYHLQANLFGFNPIQNTEILGNDIHIENAYSGIHNEGGSSVRIAVNAINAAMPNYWGIMNLNSNNNQLICNRINEMGGYTPVGLLNVDAPDNLWSCNRFFQGGRGMHLAGGGGNTQINGNAFHNFFITAIELDGNSLSMVNQINTGNTFDYVTNGPTNTIPGATCVGPLCNTAAAGGTAPTFFVNPFYMQALFPNTPATWQFNAYPIVTPWGGVYNVFDDALGVLSVTTDPMPCVIPIIGTHQNDTTDCGDGAGGGGAGIVVNRLSALDSTIAMGGMIPVIHSEGILFNNETHLYQKLYDEAKLWENNAVMQAFWDSKATTNFPLFAQVRENIINFLDISNIQTEALAFHQNIQEIRNEIVSNDSLRLISTDSLEQVILSEQNDSLRAQLIYATWQVRDLLASVHENAPNLTEIIALNNSIEPNNVMESNRKTVNTVFLATLMQEIHTLTDIQVNALENIIHQCPVEGGRAVYDARALYHIAFPGMVYNDSICTQNNERKTHPVSQIERVIAYPNPAQDEITFVWALPLEAESQIQIVNTLGEKVLLFTVPAQQKEYKASLQGLASGIYYYELTHSNTSLNTTGKFCIVK